MFITKKKKIHLLNIYSHCDKVNIFIIKHLLNIYSHRDKVNMETFIKAKQIKKKKEKHKKLLSPYRVFQIGPMEAKK
jgi:hypothetical protein